LIPVHITPIILIFFKGNWKKRRKGTATSAVQAGYKKVVQCAAEAMLVMR
jgi:hypothetical protein